MTAAVFLFGTLRHAPLRAAVLGDECPVEPAHLDGYRVLDRGGYPALVAQDEARADGVVLRPDTAQLARLDLYEGLFGYTRHVVQSVRNGPFWVYRPKTEHSLPNARPWDLSDWIVQLGDAATLASKEVMALSRHHKGDDLAVRYPMLLAHACARLRAAVRTRAGNSTPLCQPDDVEPVSNAHPYAYFFGVQSDDLRFRRFDGTKSDIVRRAGFVMSDATTVLPYDPKQDCVMLVEQFRYGLYLRAARNCWSLEAIAGRIDPGETPQEAAAREAQEEAGLSLAPGSLHQICQSYPSPGAISECLYQYLAICDLPQDDRAVGGLASEQEDIRRHVVSFDRLMQLVQTAEVQNGPLLTSAYWLALNRDRLRR